jgi:hypothetical protein
MSQGKWDSTNRAIRFFLLLSSIRNITNQEYVSNIDLQKQFNYWEIIGLSWQMVNSSIDRNFIALAFKNTPFLIPNPIITK